MRCGNALRISMRPHPRRTAAAGCAAAVGVLLGGPGRGLRLAAGQCDGLRLHPRPGPQPRRWAPAPPTLSGSFQQPLTVIKYIESGSFSFYSRSSRNPAKYFDSARVGGGGGRRATASSGRSKASWTTRRSRCAWRTRTFRSWRRPCARCRPAACAPCNARCALTGGTSTGRRARPEGLAPVPPLPVGLPCSVPRIPQEYYQRGQTGDRVG